MPTARLFLSSSKSDPSLALGSSFSWQELIDIMDRLNIPAEPLGLWTWALD